MTYGYDEIEYDEDWGECRICGEYIYLYDDDHIYAANGTPYRCAGEIEQLSPLKRKQALNQHKTWQEDQWRRYGDII